MHDVDYRVWVGCLACYNSGRLVGEWFDAADCPTEMDEFNTEVSAHADLVCDGEELWVMDHENSPVEGEYSPTAAQEYAALLEPVSSDGFDALMVWIADGNSFNADDIARFHEQFRGRHEEPADYFAECYPEEELPGWAQSHYWEILRGIARDAQLGGDITVYELGYQDFAIFDNHA